MKVDVIRRVRSSLSVLRAQPVQTSLLTLILIVFGLGLIVQSDRWHRTPAYGLLLQITIADVWGMIYLAAAVMIVTGTLLPARRSITLAGHTFTIALLGMWEFAFIVRYLTDDATTIVNVVSWGTYLCLAAWSATLIDRSTHR